MKEIKNCLAVCIVTLMGLASCIEDKGNAGFTSVYADALYANSTTGQMVFASEGNWKLMNLTNASWIDCTPATGKGGQWAFVKMNVNKNNSDQSRQADFKLQDVDVSDAYVNFSIVQSATRGDGSFGNAANIRKITGTDGSEITVDYNSYDCPINIKMSKNGEVLYAANITYSAYDSTITVRQANSDLKGRYLQGYLPESMKLISDKDTVLLEQNKGLTYGNAAFNLVRKNNYGEYDVQAVLYNCEVTTLDSEIILDSLKYQKLTIVGGEKQIKRAYLKLTLSDNKNSNRYHSLDVNQLLLGIEDCNPFALMSTFRWVRSSRLIQKAEGSGLTYEVDADYNGDESISQMTVTRSDGNTATYTFDY